MDWTKVREYVFNVARKYEHNNPEDLAQDSMIKILTYINKWDESKGNFNSWCYTVVKNKFLDNQRSKHVKHTTYDIDPRIIYDAPDLDRNIDAKAILLACNNYINDGVKERAFQMYLEGYKIDEITEETGVTKTMLYYTIRTLKAKAA